MSKTFIKGIILCLVGCFIACNKGNKTELEGSIRFGEDEIIYVYEYDFFQSKLVDSARINAKGNMKLTINIEEPSFYTLYSTYDDYIVILLKPGETYNLYADYANFNGSYELYGSEEAELLRKLDIQLFITTKKIDSLLVVYESSKDNPNFESIIPKLDSAYLQILKAQRDSTISFVIQHYNSLASIYALFQKIGESYVLNRYRDLQYYNIVYDSLSHLYPGAKILESLKKQIDDIESYINAQKIMEMAKETDMGLPEIILPTPGGDTISLYNTIQKNKFVLLSFWASWDKASVDANMELLKVYHKYHSLGLEIYQVSFDTEKQEWEKAIQLDNLPWINVSDLAYPDSKVVGTFNINTLPSNYFINSTGEIVAKNLKKDRLWEHLSTAFNE